MRKLPLGLEPHRLEAAYQQARQTLFAEQSAAGWWTGELSTSALSTATAVAALTLVLRNQPNPSQAETLSRLVSGGVNWLVEHQNSDGGWGDTLRSCSNISTTQLCRAALPLAGSVLKRSLTQSEQNCLERAETYMDGKCGKGTLAHAVGIRTRYGKDRTFSVPILMTSALAGLVGWNEVPPLPFELACFPQAWFKFLKLHVVSYALPALIAIGQTIHHHRPSWNPLVRLIRNLSRSPSLRVLERIQPTSGGFLEATPLTSFVTMALASCANAEHPVVRRAVDFLIRSVRPDGSWPIDTNLATWVTTLSVNALACAHDLDSLPKRPEILAWLLRQQYRTTHPYTGAAPGGWAWTDLPGGVPDADDTPGAILALGHLATNQTDVKPALEAASTWLLDLQNSDGGWPTFCRGWGQLPFDRSGADLTAHALRALSATQTLGRARGRRALERGLAYLRHAQRPDGSWLPLWFGNERGHDDENPTYGTARVLSAYRDLERMDLYEAKRGYNWLLVNQNADGSWGGSQGIPGSIEETALALEVLADTAPSMVVERAADWLIGQVLAGNLSHPAPIGFYFAKLWYFEKLYPIIFTIAALGRLRHNLH